MAPTSDAATGNGSASQKSMASEAVDGDKRWSGWPGNNVYRLIVPVLKVGSIIGRKGELIKKLCEDTRARVRILDGAIGTNERIVLVSGKEELDAEISPAMDAVLRIFKCINGISEPGADVVCSIRLLVPSYQSISLIGKQGTTIKSVQNGSGATVRIIGGDGLPYVTEDERVVDIQGENPKVLKALEAVVGHLRKFLVDHSVLPLYEKNINAPAGLDLPADPWVEKAQPLIHNAQQATVSDYPYSLTRDSLYLGNEPKLDSQIQRSGLSLYGQDPALAGLRSSGLGRTSGALVTQITQTMQIPLTFAEDIIGVGGGNITYIRRKSGAFITVMESRGVPDEITVEIKGTPTQVQTASQLIQDCLEGRKDPTVSNYRGFETGFRSSYSHLASSGYTPSLSSYSLGGYGAYGGYNSYRL